MRDSVRSKLEHIAKVMKQGVSKGQVEDRPELSPPSMDATEATGAKEAKGDGPCPDCDAAEKAALGGKSVAEMDLKLDALKKEEVELRDRRSKMLAAEEKATGA